MSNILEVAEGMQYQSADEELVYTVTTTNWVSSPTGPSAKAYDETTGGTEVTATVLSGSASAADDVITLPVLKSLTAGHRYRVEVAWTVSGSVYEAFFRVQCPL